MYCCWKTKGGWCKSVTIPRLIKQVGKKDFRVKNVNKTHVQSTAHRSFHDVPPERKAKLSLIVARYLSCCQILVGLGAKSSPSVNLAGSTPHRTSLCQAEATFTRLQACGSTDRASHEFEHVSWAVVNGWWLDRLCTLLEGQSLVFSLHDELCPANLASRCMVPSVNGHGIR